MQIQRIQDVASFLEAKQQWAVSTEGLCVFFVLIVLWVFSLLSMRRLGQIAVDETQSQSIRKKAEMAYIFYIALLGFLSVLIFTYLYIIFPEFFERLLFNEYFLICFILFMIVVNIYSIDVFRKTKESNDAVVIFNIVSLIICLLSITYFGYIVYISLELFKKSLQLQ